MAPEGARREELTRLVMAAQPAPFWLDRPDAPEAREPLRGEVACDLAVVGGGFGGLWAALLAKEANPGRSVVLIEGNRIGWAASGRNGGFCDASLTHGAANGRERFPDEFGTLQRLGAENLDAIEAATGRYGIDCEFERTGTITVATEDYQVAELRAAAAAGEVPGRHRGTGRGELPHLPGGQLGHHGHGHAPPGPAGLGPGRRLRADRGPDRRAHPGHRPGQRRRRRDPADPARRAAGQARGARHQRVPVTGQAAAAVHRAGLRLRAGDRAAQRGAARRGRLAEPAGRRRLGQPVPLLPADRGQPDPVGRLRRHLPLRPRRPRLPTTSGRPRSPGWRSTSSPRSRSWRASGSATAGAARSTPAAGSARSSAPPTAAGSPTRSATPASAWRPPGSAPGSCSTCSAASGPS